MSWRHVGKVRLDRTAEETSRFTRGEIFVAVDDTETGQRRGLRCRRALCSGDPQEEFKLELRRSVDVFV